MRLCWSELGVKGCGSPCWWRVCFMVALKDTVMPATCLRRRGLWRRSSFRPWMIFSALPWMASWPEMGFWVSSPGERANSISDLICVLYNIRSASWPTSSFTLRSTDSLPFWHGRWTITSCQKWPLGCASNPFVLSCLLKYGLGVWLEGRVIVHLCVLLAADVTCHKVLQ